MRIKVTSRSFSRHPILRREILSLFPDTVFQEDEDFSDQETLIDFLRDAEGAVVGLERIDETVLRNCPHLKMVAKYGVGLDNLDLPACERHGVKTGWKSGVNRRSVAEMALGFMIALSRNLFLTSNQMKQGCWNKNGGKQLDELVIGLIGIGHIGKEVVRLLQPFGCKILANDILDQPDFYQDFGLENADKSRIFREADIVSLHTPLTSQTERLINRETLSLMKPTAYLINTARGRIICQCDLAQALQKKVIAGAAIDVYEDEPCCEPEFLSLPNLICTPHCGGNSEAAILAMGRSAIDRLREFFIQ